MGKVFRWDRLVQIRDVAVLWPMNLDTGTARWALQAFGHPMFPGIREAGIVFWNGHESPDRRPADEWVDAGVLAINCGGGNLDHHPHEEFPGECAFTRVLELLGLQDDPYFEELARYVLWDDTRVKESKGARPKKEEGAFTLGRTFKDIQEAVELTGDQAVDAARLTEAARRALDWLYVALDTYYDRQVRFFTEAKQAFEAAQVIRVTIDGREWRIADGVTDCESFGRFARSRHGCNAHVVIQERSSGNVTIISSERAGLRGDSLMELIRLEEQYQRNGRATCTDERLLRQDGSLAEVPQWYYLKADPEKISGGSWMCLNGTQRHTEIEPTAIPRARRIGIVQSWIRGPHSRAHWTRKPRRMQSAEGTTEPAPVA